MSNNNKNKAIMKKGTTNRIHTIKGDFYNRRSQYGEWTTPSGKKEWVQGELEYDEDTDTFMHYYEGPRGGRYLVIFE